MQAVGTGHCKNLFLVCVHLQKEVHQPYIMNVERYRRDLTSRSISLLTN